MQRDFCIVRKGLIQQIEILADNGRQSFE